MNDKTDQMAELKASFPYQFQGQSIGLDLPPGWLPLFGTLCDNIDATLAEDEKRTFYWVQVKEKFGTARFYYFMEEADENWDAEGRGGVFSLRPIASNEKIRQLIAEAEAATGHICQQCGDPGTLRRDWCWRTLCDHHEAEYQNRIRNITSEQE